MTDRPASTDGPLYWWTARDLAAAIRRRELSAREVVACHLDRIAEVNPRVNAIVSLRPEEALAEAGRGRCPAGGRRADWSSARSAHRDQGPAGHGGDPDHVRIEAVRRQRAQRRLPARPASARRGRDRGRQDQHAGVRRRLAYVQRGVRNHPQPMGAGSVGRGQQRRCRRGAGGRPASARRRIGPRGSIRNPASFNNVVGLRPTPGLVPELRAGDAWDPRAVVGSAGADGGRSRADAHGDLRPRRALAAIVRRSRRVRGTFATKVCRDCASPGVPTSAGCQSSPRS